MKIAIMQPYIFPYIGYFQLINVVDKFIIYDDVNFIKNGWINRNRILVQKKASLFTIPLDAPSSFKKINNTYINKKNFPFWKKKFIKTIQQSYSKAPYFDQVFPLLDNVFDISDDLNISSLTTKSITEVCKYLDISTKIVESSTRYNNSSLTGKERVIDICKQEKAGVYINPIGGQELYDKDYFRNESLELNFIKSNTINYKQFNNEFLPWMSTIDVLMFNSISEIHVMLEKYSLI